VAGVAEHFLTVTAADSVAKLLANDSLVGVSTWADEVRNRDHPLHSRFAYATPWHYVDIELNEKSYDASLDCPDSNCVVAAINRSIVTLRSRDSTEEAKTIALKFLVHFVGDMHQPFHCYDNHDHGGGSILVDFFGDSDNLHHVWNEMIIERGNITERELLRQLKGENRDRIAGSINIEQWANESHAIAVDAARTVPKNHRLDARYMKKYAPIVKQRLCLAGIRLAKILNMIYG